LGNNRKPSDPRALRSAERQMVDLLDRIAALIGEMKFNPE
jgi:hypothetical protein